VLCPIVEPNAPAELRPTATKTRNHQKAGAVGRQLQWVVSHARADFLEQHYL
jgi:hypothetical protein